MDKNKKIIPFPVKKQSPKLQVITNDSETLESHYKKTMLAGGVLLTVLTVLVVNSLNLKSSEVGTLERGLASKNELVAQDEDIQVTRAIFNSVNKGDKVLLERAPSSLERFEYGVLKGRYLVRTRKGKIESIFLNRLNQRVDLYKLRNPKKFLLSHKELFSIGFNRTLLSKEYKRSDQTFVTLYSLLNEDYKSLGLVEFVTDHKKNLIRMSIKK